MKRRGFLGALVSLFAVPLAWLSRVERVPIGDPRCSCRLCVIERQYRAAIISSNGPWGDGIEWYADTQPKTTSVSRDYGFQAWDTIRIGDTINVKLPARFQTKQ